MTHWIFKTEFNAKSKINAAVMNEGQVLQQRNPVMNQRLKEPIYLWEGLGKCDERSD
jgi:hypothetical protein